MMALSEKQLNNLNKKALVIIVTSLQDQLNSMQSQLDKERTAERLLWISAVTQERMRNIS